MLLSGKVDQSKQSKIEVLKHVEVHLILCQAPDEADANEEFQIRHLKAHTWVSLEVVSLT